MLEFPTWKRVFLWAITLSLVAMALPSISSLSGVRWPDQLPDPEINLGLDLAGGSHILLEADPAEVAAQRLENMEGAVRLALRNAEPRIRHGDVRTGDGNLTFMLDDASQVDAAREAILPDLNGQGLTQEWELEIVDGSRFVISPTTAGTNDAVDNAMESATEVVRRRIDGMGTREPTIIRQGDERIVVQVPGLDDPEELKALLGETAKLEFKLVEPSQQEEMPVELARQLAPTIPGAEVAVYADDGDRPGQALIVRRLGGISGERLVDADANVDQETNSPIVNITFDSVGARQFADLTSKNVNRRFAIILDDEIISAPNIEVAILGGSSRIIGGFTTESANQLAIQLGSGALPIELTVIEERTVGPDLGADSIRSGALAMGVGTLLVIVLMIAVYGRFGVYATAALVLNVLMLLGIMAVLNTTLTLPGIAGFVLTIGAAVDANVLINERIREERKKGRRVVAAVENGYREASRAIYDANVTNAIAGILLLLFGSGPIRGFAIVLLIGLVTSVFTAVTMTRMWVASYLRDKRPTELTI